VSIRLGVKDLIARVEIHVSRVAGAFLSRRPISA